MGLISIIAETPLLHKGSTPSVLSREDTRARRYLGPPFTNRFETALSKTFENWLRSAVTVPLSVKTPPLYVEETFELRGEFERVKVVVEIAAPFASAT